MQREKEAEIRKSRQAGRQSSETIKGEESRSGEVLGMGWMKGEVMEAAASRPATLSN
jgi:hypothetical protein